MASIVKSASFFIAIAGAIPAPGIVRRATEVLHLANCQGVGTDGPSTVSYFVYYPDDSLSSQGQAPPSQNSDLAYVFTSNGPIGWEGVTVSAQFGNANIAQSQISEGNHDVFAEAGTAQIWNPGTGVTQTFDCYRDNGRTMWNAQDQLSCASIYYCLAGYAETP